MYYRNKDSGYGDHLWPRSSFTYKGFCTHSAILEGWHRSEECMLEFTSEHLEEMAAATRERNRQYQLLYARHLRANPTEAYKETQRRNNTKQALRTRQRQAKAKANSTYLCNVCNVNCRDADSLRVHCATPRHIQKVNGGPELEYRPCGWTFKYASALKAHKNFKGHIRNCATSWSFTVDFVADFDHVNSAF
ncbi:70-kilodalton heat shock protein [Curvularia kusanoi]|uniref:70-kilodalton heat shock protein n=1 Tax=Curvularia kusanoi TaxID=90978 RepID=A0A9P4TLY1_CURKU|nr:70-kilodalton heat shock protein [Curvularia kusanoi]